MSNAELAPITKASCLNLSLTRLMLALLASHTATGRSLVWPDRILYALAYGPLRSLSAVAAVFLRSCVPGTAGNKREQPSTNPSLFAAFASNHGEVQGSEPATFHRGDRCWIARLSGIRGCVGGFVCGRTSTPTPQSYASRSNRPPCGLSDATRLARPH